MPPISFLPVLVGSTLSATPPKPTDKKQDALDHYLPGVAGAQPLFLYANSEPLPDSGLVSFEDAGNGILRVVYEFGGIEKEGLREPFRLKILVQANTNGTLNLLWGSPNDIGYLRAQISTRSGVDTYDDASLLAPRIVVLNNGSAIAFEGAMVEGLPYLRAVEVELPYGVTQMTPLRLYKETDFSAGVLEGEEMRAVVAETVVHNPDLLLSYRQAAITTEIMMARMSAHLRSLRMADSQIATALQVMGLQRDDPDGYEFWCRFVNIQAYHRTCVTLLQIQRFGDFMNKDVEYSRYPNRMRLILDSVGWFDNHRGDNFLFDMELMLELCLQWDIRTAAQDDYPNSLRFVQAYPGFDPQLAYSLWGKSYQGDFEAFLTDYRLYEAMIIKLNDNFDLRMYVEVFQRRIPRNYWATLFDLVNKKRQIDFIAVMRFLQEINRASSENYLALQTICYREDTAASYLQIADRIGFGNATELLLNLAQEGYKLAPNDLAGLADLVQRMPDYRIPLFKGQNLTTIQAELTIALACGEIRYVWVIKRLREMGVKNQDVLYAVVQTLGAFDATKAETALVFFENRTQFDATAFFLAQHFRNVDDLCFADVYNAAAAICSIPDFGPRERVAALEVALRYAGDVERSANFGASLGAQEHTRSQYLAAAIKSQNEQRYPTQHQMGRGPLPNLTGCFAANLRTNLGRSAQTRPQLLMPEIAGVAIASRQNVIVQALNQIEPNLGDDLQLPLTIGDWEEEMRANHQDPADAFRRVIPSAPHANLVQNPDLVVAIIVALQVENGRPDCSVSTIVRQLLRQLSPTVNTTYNVFAHNGRRLDPDIAATIPSSLISSLGQRAVPVAATVRTPIPVLQAVAR